MPSETTRAQRHHFHRLVPYSQARRWEHRLVLLREHPSWAVKLWSTVLDEAIKDLLRKRSELTRGGCNRPWQTRQSVSLAASLRRRTLWWFTEPDDPRTPGAYAWICRELDLPVDAVRYDVLCDAGVREELN